MKTKTLIIILLFSSSLFSQNLDSTICNCINTNFLQIGVDYIQVLNKIEDDLIINHIIDETEESRVKQLNFVSKNGEIENTRTYENILWEQLGLRTIKYCVNRSTYSSQYYDSPQIFKMFGELEGLNLKYYESHKLQELRKETAATILRHYNNRKQSSKLWKIIQLDYLYLFSETKEMKGIGKLIEFDSTKPDTSNTVKIFVGAENIITFDKMQVKEDEICNLLKPFLLEGKGIYFSNEKNTKYKFYINVYKSIKNCIQELRIEKSIELFEKTYEHLNQKEKRQIKEIIPMRIIETESL